MKIEFFPLMAAVCIAAGCSSVPTKVDSGPITAATFSFVDRGARPTPAFADSRQPIHLMIQQSVARNLANKGVTQVASGGDITVGYLVIIGNNAATESIDDYFGYGSDSAAVHEKAQATYTSSKNPNYFEAGTLVIDLIDSKSFKLLKRNYVVRPILRDAPPDVRASRIQEAVDEALRDLRISKRS